VLTGHSLGAGVVELLAILLKGGELSSVDGGKEWCLPDDVELAMYLFAPPPAYRPLEDAGDDDENSDCDEDEREERRAAMERLAAERSAAMAARECAVGFAANYDIIPRTSLHNGFNLFQEARAVDLHVNWRKRDILRKLQEAKGTNPERAKSARGSIIDAVGTALQQGVVFGPSGPPKNPFAPQHPVTARMHHIIGVPGGTATFKASPRPSSSEVLSESLSGSFFACGRHHRPYAPQASSGSAAASPAGSPSVDLGASPSSAAADASGAEQSAARPPGHWLYKRSNIVKEWRRRYAWVSEGALSVCSSADGPAKLIVPLTAGATMVTLFGAGSAEAFPMSVVECATVGENIDGMEAAEEASASAQASDDSSANEGVTVKYSHRTYSQKPPTAWVFKVATASVGGVCELPAASTMFCADSLSSRDRLVREIVEAVRGARHACYRVQPAVPPEEFGREALLADGCFSDHSVARYEAALETMLERTTSSSSPRSA